MSRKSPRDEHDTQREHNQLTIAKRPANAVYFSVHVSDKQGLVRERTAGGSMWMNVVPRMTPVPKHRPSLNTDGGILSTGKFVPIMGRKHPTRLTANKMKIDPICKGIS